MVHVIAGGVGISAIILASAQLFTVLKFLRRALPGLAGRPHLPGSRRLCRRAAGEPQQRLARIVVRAFSSRLSIPRRPPSSSPSSRNSSIPLQPPGAAVRHARVDLGCAEHGRGYRGDRFRHNDAQSIHGEAAAPAPAATGVRALHRRPRYFVGAGAASGRELAQRSRMHPPGGMLQPDLVRSTPRFRSILIDRETGRA